MTVATGIIEHDTGILWLAKGVYGACGDPGLLSEHGFGKQEIITSPSGIYICSGFSPGSYCLTEVRPEETDGGYRAKVCAFGNDVKVIETGIERACDVLNLPIGGPPQPGDMDPEELGGYVSKTLEEKWPTLFMGLNKSHRIFRDKF